MQTTSQLWKTLWASGAARLETMATIAGVDYTDLPTAPVINRALMQNGLSIGNAVSATCTFTVRTNNTIPKSATVVIKYRLTDGTSTSEWLTAGTFYISHRSRDPVTGVTTLLCYDCLLKANADMPAFFPWTTKGGTVMTTQAGQWLYLSAAYPQSMTTILNNIASVLGMEIDSATQIATGSAYVIEEAPPGTKIIDILRKIAAANGGNWIVTPQNTLRLVPVISCAGAQSATSNVIDVAGIVGGIAVSSTGTITGIRYRTDSGDQIAGTDTGIVIEADVSQAVAEALQQTLVGMTYQAYTISGAVYDPAGELGDYVRAGANGEVRAVLYSEAATLGPAFRGEISAPEIGELADEYPYVGPNMRTLELAQQYAAEVAHSAANSAVQTFSDSLTQQEIFDRLTDNGQTQGISLGPAMTPALGADSPMRIYLNVDYVNEGEMSFSRLKGDTLTLGGANNTNGILEVLDAEGDAVCYLSNTGADITNGTITSYSADKIDKAFLSSGQLQFQTYGQDGGSGQEMWLPRFQILLERESGGWSDTAGLYARGKLYIRAYNDITITNKGAPNPAGCRIIMGYDGTMSISAGSLSINTNSDVDITGNVSASSLSSGDGAIGTFTTADGKTVTVSGGIITNIT